MSTTDLTTASPEAHAATPAAPSGRLLEQRHQLERPALEDRFARLAIDHPEHCTRTSGQYSEGVSA